MTARGATMWEAIKAPLSPFPGLRPFKFDESHLFFGRDGQIEKLIVKLAATRFLAVVGTSGSGKSSLVQAGLLPALLGGVMTSAGAKWRFAVMRPANDPIGALAEALNTPEVFGSEDADNVAIQTEVARATLRRGRRGLVEVVEQNALAPEENLLVVVDQFEELFRFAREAARKSKQAGDAYQNEAAAFVNLLLEAYSQREANIYVLLTMRSDFLGDCSQFWGLPEAINDSQYLIPRLERKQLREVITGPVELGGGEITPRLVTQLLNDIGDNQDQLPVLQHLLMRMWNECKEQRLEVEIESNGAITKATHRSIHKGNALDTCCYEAVGGMTQALSRHADEAFNDLPSDAARELAEKLFKTLTEKGTDNRETRRPVTLAEICAVVGASESEIKTIIETFRQPGRSFLMPPDEVPLSGDSLIDISHESLIRGWTRLKQWVDEETRSARIYLRVAETAVLRDEGGAGLWRDPDLQIALTWREQSKPNEIWARRYHSQYGLAMSFLDDSVAERDADVEKEEARRTREIKRTRLTILILGVALGVSMVAGGYAVGQSRKARIAQLNAEMQAERANYNFQEAEKQKANVEREKETAVAAQIVALRSRDEADEAKQRAEVSAKEAQANLVEANKQRVAAQQASERVKAEALNGQGLSALKEENETEALFYFNQLHEHYQKTKDESGRSLALTTIADIHKQRVPMFLLSDFVDETEAKLLAQQGGPEAARMMKQYYQAMVIAAQLEEGDDEVGKQQILKNSQEAFKYYQAALSANTGAVKGKTSSELSFKRGGILQNIGDLYLVQLGKELGRDVSIGDVTTKGNEDKAFEKMLDYYTQAAAAYKEAGRPLEEAEMLRKTGFLLYKNWVISEPKSKEAATSGTAEAPAIQQYKPRTLPPQLERVVDLYKTARTQFQQAGNPSLEAAILIRIADVYEKLPEGSSERRTAITYLQQARDIYQKQKNFGREAEAAEQVAKLHEDMSEPAEQLSALKQALEAYYNASAVTSTKNSQYESRISDLVNRVGTLLYQSTDKEAAKRYFDDLDRRGDAPPVRAKLLGSIAAFYNDKDKQEAIRYLSRKRKLHQQAHDLLEEAEVLIQIASLHEQTGQAAEMMEALNAAFSIYRNAGDAAKKPDNNLTDKLFIIAEKYAKSDKQKALAVYEEALNIAKLSPWSYSISEVLRRAGPMLLEMKSEEGNAKARQFFQKGLDAAPHAISKASSLSAIGDIYRDAGNKQEAQAFYERAFAIYRAEKELEFLSLTNLIAKMATLETEGNPQRSMGDFYLSKAGSARRAGDPVVQAMILELAAAFYRDTPESKDEQKALDCLDQARLLYNAAGLKSKEASLLRDMAAIYYRQGKTEKASELSKQADQVTAPRSGNIAP